jgi:hypothetical protein
VRSPLANARHERIRAHPTYLSRERIDARIDAGARECP